MDLDLVEGAVEVTREAFPILFFALYEGKVTRRKE